MRNAGLEEARAGIKIPRRNITDLRYADDTTLMAMAQVVEIFQKCGDRIDVYSGEDGLVVPMLSMGAMGCISVLSNVVPKQSVEMCDKFFAGDVAGAAALQLELLELVNCLFCEVNPIPAKAAISAMGFGTEHLRLPLTPMEPKNRERLYAEMKRLGVLK